MLRQLHRARHELPRASRSSSLCFTISTFRSMSSADQPREWAMNGNCGKSKPSSAKKASIWPATAWMLSCPPVMMNAATLLRIRTVVADRDLVLDAVHPLDHLEVERAGRAPADRRRDQDHVGPVHERLVDRSSWSAGSICVIEQGQVQACALFE